ncbi:hypothetical protein GCM10027445_13160 [Amycolatopsis endophytica]
MKRRKAALAATTLAIAATVALTGIGTASAAPTPPGDSWDHVWTAKDGTAKLYVEEHGDLISICDTKANGDSAHVHVYVGVNGPLRYTARATGGKGNCSVHSASQGGKYNLPETNQKIYLWFGGDNSSGDTMASFFNDH